MPVIEIIWDEFELIYLKIYERGNPNVDDEYNKRLIKYEQKLLFDVEYIFDKDSDKFLAQINSIESVK